jgi:lysophospholipase
VSQSQLTDVTPRPAFDRRAIPIAACESVWQAPDGYPVRQIDWQMESDVCRGSILFLPGRGDFYEKYLETLADWHSRGWRVTAVDWRGQGGSGRLGNDRVTGHIDDYSTWVGDLAAFWTRWKAETPVPHVLVGHSMGGHLALRALAESKADPDALVLCAPMLGLASSALPNWLMQGIARLMTMLGDPRRPAWKWEDKPGQFPASREQLLTHDSVRYGDELFWRETRPELVMGPGSWGWVERSYASMRRLEKAGVLEAISQPVLIMGTSDDKLVSFAAIARAAKRLRRGEFLRFGPEARHEILREEDIVRSKALLVIDDFLDRNAPMAG